MDLLDGEVVHAVGGEREEYEPVESFLTDSSNPLEIATIFENEGFKEIYLADLNSIQNKGDNLEVIHKLASETSLNLMIDAGFENPQESKPYIESGVSKIIFATETLKSFEGVVEISEKYPALVVGSIDMKEGEVLANSKKLRMPVSQIVHEFEKNNVSEIIILSLKKVGTSTGLELKTLENIVKISNVPVLVGGGVSDIFDVQQAENIGVSGVLIATAFHNGSIKFDELNYL